jgi:hypothetical protein
MRKVETMRPPAAIVDETFAALSSANYNHSRTRAFHSSNARLAMSGLVALPLAGQPAGGDIRARLAQILDIFREDSWRRGHAGELEVRPPGAPTAVRI